VREGQLADLNPGSSIQRGEIMEEIFIGGTISSFLLMQGYEN
jgi:hypothetical protein